jgi:predicted phage-related endonuclease
MDSWNTQLELAKSRIAEIEDKIALQRQRAEQNDDTAIRLISVMQESLARAKAHAQYIEQRIAADEADSGRRKALAALINVVQIERKIADFHLKAKEIENAIRAEEDRTGIHDPARFAYSAAAKGKIERRDNLMRVVDALKLQLAHAKAALDRARPNWREHRAQGTGSPAG